MGWDWVWEEDERAAAPEPDEQMGLPFRTMQALPIFHLSAKTSLVPILSRRIKAMETKGLQLEFLYK